MDQSISCQDINYIYKHPLSILIHLKFQDKDGCSKNGSREFFYQTAIACTMEWHFSKYSTIPQIMWKGSGEVDYRGKFWSFWFNDDTLVHPLPTQEILDWKNCLVSVGYQVRDF